jgi:hypothetical protein
LRDRYGDGRFATQAAHFHRWKVFASFLRNEGIKDARDINTDVLKSYGRHLNDQIQSESLTVAYVQNILSSVNVVLESLRGDRAVSVSPSEFAGQRSHIREDSPHGINANDLDPVLQALREKGEDGVACIAELCRWLGLRFREASLLDARGALKQALESGRINITEGTKGGRGREIDRWIPISPNGLRALKIAADLQKENRNNVLRRTFSQWRDHAYYAYRRATENHALRGFHDLRAAYACDRYQQITDCHAPVIAGKRIAAPEIDLHARKIISVELGHSRVEIVASYVGAR